MRTLLSLILCVAACGGDAGTATPSSDPAPAAADTPADEPIRPAPGAILEGPPAAPQVGGTGAVAGRDVTPVDLGADRVPVPVAVPALPRGASAGFAFDGERRGWATRIPDAQQLPAAAFGDGRIYVSGGVMSTSYYGLDAGSGQIAWVTTNLEDNGPTAAIYQDGRVLFNTESCTLFALDARTGARLWHRWLGDPTLAQVASAAGLVYAAHPGADGEYQLSAYRVRDGGWVWSRHVGAELLAGPVIHGGSVYASTLRGATFRFDAATGKRMWRSQLRATTAPWVAGDELFVARRRGPTEEQVVVDVDDGKVVRTHHAARGYLHDVPTTKAPMEQVWAFEGSRPVVSGGVRYVAMGGELRATDAATGAPLWSRRYAAAPDRRSLGSVALAGPQVVVSTRDGQLFGIDVDTGYTLWAYDLDVRVMAQPIVARGWLYVTTATGYVIGLQVADETLDGWHMFGGDPTHSGVTI